MKVITREQASLSANEIMKRLAPLRKSSPNAPKGVPAAKRNDTDTNVLFPTQHNQPQDNGFNFATMVTGSGGGPVL